MKLLKMALLLLIINISTILAATTPQQYAIEIIVFSQPSKQALQNEHWPFFDGQLDIPKSSISWPTSNITQDSSPTDTTSSITTPSEDADIDSSVAHLSSWDNSLWQLNKAAKRIDRSRFYTLLEHTAFIAQRSDLSNGVLVHLDSQSTTAPTGQSQSQDQTSTLQASSNGIVAIKLDHYFNIKFNFTQAIPTTQLQDIDSDWNNNKYWGNYSYFHYLADRRLRSKEANYIDFPTLGIIVQITPINA
jgi:hypothetical protein